MNYKKLKATVTDEVKKRILNASLDFVNTFRFHDSDDPTDVIAEFDLNYSKSSYDVIRAVLEGVRDGINAAGDTAFDKCISKAVANGDISEERADIVSNEYKSYENMNINGMKADKVDGKDCIRFSYSEEDDGWQDDSMAAIADGRFFRANNLNEDDFVWSREEVPEKDGNYLCICRHGKRYTVETHSFFAKVIENGFVRADSQWGFDCEHVPPHISSSYPILLWSPKSYRPFNKQGGLKV